jgi:DNA-binding YbaB/EbfC family protein
MTTPSMGIERLLRHAQEMQARAEKFAQQQAELQSTGESPDGLVTVALDGQLKVTAVDINPRAMRLDSQTLAESVQAALDTAYAAHTATMADLMAEMIGDDDIARQAREGSLAPEELFRRFGVDLNSITDRLRPH